MPLDRANSNMRITVDENPIRESPPSLEERSTDLRINCEYKINNELSDHSETFLTSQSVRTELHERVQRVNFEPEGDDFPITTPALTKDEDPSMPIETSNLPPQQKRTIPLKVGRPPLKQRPFSTSRNQQQLPRVTQENWESGHSTETEEEDARSGGQVQYIIRSRKIRIKSGRSSSLRSRSSRLKMPNSTANLLSNQSDSTRVISGRAWASQTQETSQKIKAIRNEYSHPIDNLASLKNSLLPKMSNINIVPTPSAKDEVPRNKSTGRERK